MDKDGLGERAPEITSEEIQEIITSIPSWIIRVGTTLVLLAILLMIILSSVISYPDIISANLKINSLNSPKVVLSRQTAKITTLLVENGKKVVKNEPLAFMESTANHKDVIQLQQFLLHVSDELKLNHKIKELAIPDFNLGEVQGDYQTFYEQYLEYVSAQDGGYYVSQKLFLQKDLLGIKKIDNQLKIQQELQKKELENNAGQFEAYKKLYAKKVVSASEYKEQENKYLSSQFPIQTTATAFLNNNTAYLAKEKEILELDHIVKEQKSKFQQALGSIITKTSAWLNLYVLRAPIKGLVNYAGVIQQDQTVSINQELFMINPSNTDFFGEIEIPQYNMGKIKLGQTVLVKMRSFPFEQYGLMRGKVDFISDVALRDSVFFARVSFEKTGNTKIRLKNGMRAEAQVITEESTVLQRFLRNITSMLNH